MQELHEIYPFPALIGQDELKLALLLALVNPAIGGVLLEGPYGVGKTTAVRALLDLMPPAWQPVCPLGCEEDHPDEQCPDCRERVARGERLVRQEPVRLIELPLTARLEDVVGGIDERVALEQRRVLLEPGVLRTAHGNILYVDEINLLDAPIADAILDAAAQGRTFVRRGAMVRLYPSRFVLIGSMNPEEGRLRPQIMDRFGLRVWVPPLGPAARLEAARNGRAFQSDPRGFRARYAPQLAALATRVAEARDRLPAIDPDVKTEQVAVALVDALHIPSHRAENALIEAARAHAALASHGQADIHDLRVVAALALRQRRSAALEAESIRVAAEDTAIREALRDIAHD
jgi:magnesium chelatase subunit I